MALPYSQAPDRIKAGYERARAATQPAKPLWPAEYCEDTPDALWSFVLLFRTWDEAEKVVRPFPDRPYLQRACRDWLTAKKIGKPIIFHKCRRMVVSWLCRICELWAMGCQRQDAMLGGDDYEAAAKHCWRYWHLYEDLRQNAGRLWNLPKADRILYQGERMLKAFMLSNGSQCNIVNAKPRTVQGEGAALMTYEEWGMYEDPASVLGQATIVGMGDATSTAKGFICCITNATTNPKYIDFKRVRDGESPAVEILHGYRLRMLTGGEIFVDIDWDADESRDAAWLERLRIAMISEPHMFRLQILKIDTQSSGALWTWDMIDQFRLTAIPESARIVKWALAIDPSVLDPAKRKDPNKEPDECGLIAGALDSRGHVYITTDLSGIMSPAAWASRAMRTAVNGGFNEIIYEDNQGKDLIPEVLKGYGRGVPCRGVNASIGKRPRAEPAVVAYELGKVHHIGHLALLEQQLTSWDASNPGSLSPGRLDALVWLLFGFGLCSYVESEQVDIWIDQASQIR